MIIDLLNSHASVRSYTDEVLSKETVRELVSAGQHAASSHFVQAYSVVHATDEAVREKLGEYSKNPHQFNGAGAALVFCADFHRLQAAAALHDRSIDFSHAEALLVGTIDVALFAQNIAIAAESKGYGICYIGGVRNNPAEISELLKLPDGVVPLFGMTIGVPAKVNEVKPRLPVDAVLHENMYDASNYEEVLRGYDATMATYYETRSSNQKIAGWTEQMADFLESPQRPYMKEFLRDRGFKFD
ncbi:oxygen-insensitive NADPH nitroreductase [Sporosarcina gallistercoris]|uniref:Oxygen-insensitive NADPH nitroreductase n=1 Tax=Sporosarcina gallistercoris TaxID=2762245 RepID=A0ABR8PGY8_9BACL|nr:oxygen-insensitive NADPH nitroreductase [Sporosarcina gallistercoris]MBD7907435.1 oxygen-insensitive NADPH nitroreductase [Sporosarcina gallistercoris]